MSEYKYTMTISLNVLNHLGIKLYSNVPAVLSEVVANSWDADAENVEIEIKKDKIVITDDGEGMTLDDINSKYLNVGYERRKDKEGAITPKWNRHVMGRKGIGKLSLFSIANTVEVHSLKDGKKNGLSMSATEIEKSIKKQQEDPNKSGIYNPADVPIRDIILKENGTRIILTDLKKSIYKAEIALRKRIARRFSIIGSEYHFSVIINKKPVGIEDRDYFHKIQFLWYYGEESKKFVDFCIPDKINNNYFERSNELPDTDYKGGGWIGTVEESGDLGEGEDNLNKIVILVRGKLAQEDILEDFVEGRLFTKYLIGELHADFFDIDDKEDITTTSRQEIIKDDPRYQSLKKWLESELDLIGNSWTDLRNKEGAKKALKIPVIYTWYNELSKDYKRRARNLFGKINQLTLQPEEKRSLFKHSILAFESYRYKQNLDALERITPENLAAFSLVFADLDDIEATLYHQITKERLMVIETLHERIEDVAIERVIQEHLYKHLWLLDPSWERATETPLMEEKVTTAFGKIDAKLTEGEREGRFDIKYKKTSGKHIIIELKRADKLVSSPDLMKQVDRYRTALLKILDETGYSNEPVEVICILGRNPKDWTDPTREEEWKDSLAKLNIRVVLYQQLIEEAYRSYQSYLDKSHEAGRVYRLIQSIEAEDFE